MIKCKKIFRSIGEIRVYQLEDDSLMLHNDLYQINMAESYWNDNIHEKWLYLICILEKCHLIVAMLFLMV